MAEYEKARRAKATIDAEEDATAQNELAGRNEATAARQNAAAFRPRQNPRAGGSRYTRRGMWTPGGSGLDRANAQSRVDARKKARYARLNESLASAQSGYTPPSITIGAPVFTVYH